MQSQRQPDTLAVTGGGSAASGIPVGPVAAWRAERRASRL